MSIESLPVYAAFSRFFVVIAPPVTAGGVVYNHWTYAKRGWCRLEQWARIAQCGVKNMYVCHGQGVDRPLVSFSANMTALSVAADVMNGEFTVAHDRVKLVDVMVQLYHQLQTSPSHLSEGHGDAIGFLRTYVTGNRDSLFPKELFADYILLVEAFCKASCGTSRDRWGRSQRAGSQQTFMDYGTKQRPRPKKGSKVQAAPPEDAPALQPRAAPRRQGTHSLPPWFSPQTPRWEPGRRGILTIVRSLRVEPGEAPKMELP